MIIDFKIKNEIDLEELWAKTDYLNALDQANENDRAYILVSAVAIEDQVFKILKAISPSINCLSDNKDFTFSIKINLLKSFEFCNPNIIEYANLIRKIRNDFAHNLLLNDFESLSESNQNHINQIIGNINQECRTLSYKIKITTIVKWLFWELNSLIPYAKKLREIIESQSTKSLLNQ